MLKKLHGRQRNKLSKKMGEGLTWSQIFRRELLRKRGLLFLGGGEEVAILTQKNKLESKVLNNKNKFITKMFLSFISILKNSIFKGGGEVHEKLIYRGNYLKRETWTVEDLRGAWQKRGWWCFVCKVLKF